MKVYELMARLEEMPSGAEVMCSGVETLDSITNEATCGEDEMGNKEYPVTRNVVDVDKEGKRVFLQW